MSDVYEAFELVDMRVGRILNASLNPKARVPAYMMTIDFGELGTRNCSGQYPAVYSAEDLIGRQVICVMNLGAKRIAGYESQVLMLGVPNEEGKPVFLTPEREVPLGTRVY